jgi:glutamine amidotransferase
MSSRYPTSVGFSLETLARHGGRDGPQKDGWGVAYFEDRDAFLLREPSPAAESNLVRFMEKNGPPSNLVLSHIRHATQGEPALRNTQPFQRELGGRAHVFAHNGNLPGIREQCGLETFRYRCIGETDSEFAFCCLLERLEAVWGKDKGNVPSIESRVEVVAARLANVPPVTLSSINTPDTGVPDCVRSVTVRFVAASGATVAGKSTVMDKGSPHWPCAWQGAMS